MGHDDTVGRRDVTIFLVDALLAAVEAAGKVVSGTSAHLDLFGLAVVTPVLEVDSLDRHLRSARLLQDHLRKVIEVIASTGRALGPRVATPTDLARAAGQPQRPVAGRLAAQIIVG